jgi:hypothetical protein
VPQVDGQSSLVQDVNIKMSATIDKLKIFFIINGF